MNPNTEPILDAANKFLWSDGMQESMDAFATNYAEMFTGVRRKVGEELMGEQRLEWTEAHREFSELFEFHLEQFLETQPFSTEDFVDACKDALAHGTWEDCGRTVQVVLSMIEYDSFVALMVDKAEERALEAAMGALGDAEDEEEEAAGHDGQYGGGRYGSDDYGGGVDGGAYDAGGGGAYGGAGGYGDADADAGGLE